MMEKILNKTFLIISIFFLLVKPASSVEYIMDLRGIKSATVKVVDSVDGGCWRSPGAAKTYVEKELLSSGILVLDEKADVTVRLISTGFPLSNVGGKKTGCTASYRLDVSFLMMAKPPYFDKISAVSVILFELSGIVSGGGDLSSQLNNYYRNLAAKFSVKVMKANAGK